MKKKQRHLQVGLRLPKNLRNDLAAAADRNKKSLNQEIVQRLTDSFAHYRVNGINGRLDLLDLRLQGMMGAVDSKAGRLIGLTDSLNAVLDEVHRLHRQAMHKLMGE